MSKILSPVLSPGDFELSGPALLRKTFFPRHRLTITDLAKVLGLSRDRIYKRMYADKLDLKISYDEAGRPFVVLDDLVEYLYPSSPPSLATATTPAHKNNIKKPGPSRPRKPIYGAEGGGR